MQGGKESLVPTWICVLELMSGEAMKRVVK